jgi:hypothetical protein
MERPRHDDSGEDASLGAGHRPPNRPHGAGRSRSKRARPPRIRFDGTGKDRSGRAISSGDGCAHDDHEPAVGRIGFPPYPPELCGVHIVGQQPNAKPVDRAACSTRASAGTIGSQHGGRFEKRCQARAPWAETHPCQGHCERETAWKTLTGEVVGIRAAIESQWTWRLGER